MLISLVIAVALVPPLGVEIESWLGAVKLQSRRC